LNLGGEGSGCTSLTGRFQVLEADYSEAGRVERFHATFEQHCDGAVGALFGEVQIVSSALGPTQSETPTAADISIAVQDGRADNTSSDEVNAPEAQRRLSAGKILKVLSNGCKLRVRTDTPEKVVVFCKAIPMPTATKTWAATNTPGPSKTPAPQYATVHVENLTGGQLCYEVLGTGIGEKCFSGGVSLYGSFPVGTYSWKVSSVCGALTGSYTVGAGNWVHTFKCVSGSLKPVMGGVARSDP
jgi:hypothetical protein